MGSTKKITFGALLAATFAVTAFLFKGFVLIPGITELRPVNAYPIIFGLLFGPLGAWASAIGNLIGDLFGGTIGLASIGGFIGNYAMGFVPYAVWQAFWKKEGDLCLQLQSIKDYAFWLSICFLSSITAAVTVSLAVDIVGIVPFNILFIIIFINNIVSQIVVGTILYNALTKTKARQAIERYIAELQDPNKYSRRKATLLCTVLIIAFALGISFSLLLPNTLWQIEIIAPMALFSIAMVGLMRY